MNEEEKQVEDYSRMVNSNTILLSLEGWIKFVEGFTKGLQTTDKVSSIAVLDCVGEILEYMTSFKNDIIKLFQYCENILVENEKLREELEIYKSKENIVLIENKEKEDE
jgi:hypothetical protein